MVTAGATLTGVACRRLISTAATVGLVASSMMKLYRLNLIKVWDHLRGMVASSFTRRGPNHLGRRRAVSRHFRPLRMNGTVENRRRRTASRVVDLRTGTNRLTVASAPHKPFRGVWRHPRRRAAGALGGRYSTRVRKATSGKIGVVLPPAHARASSWRPTVSLQRI
jgi:hypothetical protein